MCPTMIFTYQKMTGRKGGSGCGPGMWPHTPSAQAPRRTPGNKWTSGKALLTVLSELQEVNLLPPLLPLPSWEGTAWYHSERGRGGGREMQVVTQALCLGCCDVRVMGTWVNPTKRQKHGRKQRQCFRAQKWKLILSKVGQGGTSFFLNGVSKSSRTQRITIRCWFHPLTFNL